MEGVHRTVIAAAACLALVVLPLACGKPEARPLEVTYYYLPG